MSQVKDWELAGILKDHEDGFHDDEPLENCPECQEELEDRKNMFLDN